jgi:hypothetical protein
MHRTLFSTLVVAGTVLVSGLSTSAASASWFVEGSEQTSGSKAVATTAKVDSAFTFSVPAVKFKAACTASALHALEPVLASPGLMQTKSLTFEGCKTTEPASGCELASSTIGTTALYAAPVEGSGGSDLKLLVSAQTKNAITELSIAEESTCPFEGIQSVKGSVRLDAKVLKAEGGPQIVEGLGSTENNSLEIGSGNKLFLTGSDLIALAASQKWSASPISLSTDPSSLSFGLVAGTKGVTFLVKNAKLALEAKAKNPSYLIEGCVHSIFTKCSTVVRLDTNNSPSSIVEAGLLGAPLLLAIPLKTE